MERGKVSRIFFNLFYSLAVLCPVLAAGRRGPGAGPEVLASVDAALGPIAFRAPCPPPLPGQFSFHLLALHMDTGSCE